MNSPFEVLRDVIRLIPEEDALLLRDLLLDLYPVTPPTSVQEHLLGDDDRWTVENGEVQPDDWRPDEGEGEPFTEEIRAITEEIRDIAGRTIRMIRTDGRNEPVFRREYGPMSSSYDH